MSKEIRLGILALVAIVVLIWGYKFLLGQNILSRSNTYFVEYKNVSELNASDPVIISGMQVGTVQDIYLKPEDLKTVVVSLDVRGDVKLPPSTTAELRSTGVMGGKAIVLDYEGICTNDCLPAGSYLTGKEFGLLQSMVAPDDLDAYVNVVKDGIGQVIDTLNRSLSSEEGGEVAATTRSFAQTIQNLEAATSRMNYLFQQSTGKLVSLLDNLDAIAGKLRANSDEVSTALHNINQLTHQLVDSRVDSTIILTNTAIKGSAETIDAMTVTLKETRRAMTELQELLTAVNQGEGTLGGLAHNRELYDNLNQASENLDLLLQDFRLNPKRYIGGFLGKKQKPYVAPKSDPAHPTSTGDQKTPDSTN